MFVKSAAGLHKVIKLSLKVSGVVAPSLVELTCSVIVLLILAYENIRAETASYCAELCSF